MLKLYSYWRSSASYRVRIALALKGLAYETVAVHLVKDGGGQHSAEYRALNPQARVPLLVHDDFAITQSLAIFDYLELLKPLPALLPADLRERTRTWAFCQAIAADIQPLHNLGTLTYLTQELAVAEVQKAGWIKHWIDRGLAALEVEWAARPDSSFVMGDTPSYADCVLVPQIYAAERFHCDLSRYPRLAACAQRARALPAFAAAHPDQQVDAQPG